MIPERTMRSFTSPVESTSISSRWGSGQRNISVNSMCMKSRASPSRRIHSGQEANLRDGHMLRLRHRVYDRGCDILGAHHVLALGEPRFRVGIDRIPDVRIDRTWRNEGRANPTLPCLLTNYFVHAPQPELAGGVGGQSREPDVVGDGSDGHQMPAAALDHSRADRAD